MVWKASPMHHSVAQVFIEFCLLTIVLDQYSVVQCAKSLSLKQNNGNNGNKQASKQAAPKKSAPKQRGPARNDTTILAKLASHGKEWHYGMHWTSLLGVDNIKLTCASINNINRRACYHHLLDI